MNRLERKTTATLLIAIFMISAFAFAVNAGTGIELQEAGAGEAVFRPVGDVQLSLPSAYAAEDAARVKVPQSGLTLGDITSLSYKYYIDAAVPVKSLYDGFIKEIGAESSSGAGYTDAFGGPYLVIELDTDEVAGADSWLIQVEFASTSKEAWTTDTIEATTHFHGYGSVPPELPGWQDFSLYQATYSDAVVLAVKVAIGQWDPGQGPAGPVIVYVDDIEVNGGVYDLKSNVVAMMSSTRPPVISINVDPTDIDFGLVIAGDSSARDVTVANTGERAVIVSTEFIEDTDSFYATYLSIPLGNGYIAEEDSRVFTLTLSIPQGFGAGTYEGTVVFWAEEYTP